MQNDKDDIIENEVVEEGGLNDKIKKLREALKLCQKEKAEYLAGWQRAKADFINARKDEERVRAEFAKFATERVLREMLAIADSLELAGEGANPVCSQLQEILKREGVEPIETKGKKFDPMHHEALEEKEVLDEKEDNIIVEELQRGYTIHNRVLRPSKVKVGVYKINNQ